MSVLLAGPQSRQTFFLKAMCVSPSVATISHVHCKNLVAIFIDWSTSKAASTLRVSWFSLPMIGTILSHFHRRFLTYSATSRLRSAAAMAVRRRGGKAPRIAAATALLGCASVLTLQLQQKQPAEAASKSTVLGKHFVADAAAEAAPAVVNILSVVKSTCSLASAVLLLLLLLLPANAMRNANIKVLIAQMGLTIIRLQVDFLLGLALDLALSSQMMATLSPTLMSLITRTPK